MPVVLIANRQESEVEEMLSRVPEDTEVRLLPTDQSIPTNVASRLCSARYGRLTSHTPTP